VLDADVRLHRLKNRARELKFDMQAKLTRNAVLREHLAQQESQIQAVSEDMLLLEGSLERQGDERDRGQFSEVAACSPNPQEIHGSNCRQRCMAAFPPKVTI
jgi:hypothetical protein